MSPTDQPVLDANEGLDRIIIGVTMHSDDYEEGIDICQRFSGHENEWVRRAVIEGLSHVARVHKKMDLEFALPLIAKGLEDDSRLVRGEAENTLDDFEMFLPGFTWEKHGFDRPDIPE